MVNLGGGPLDKKVPSIPFLPTWNKSEMSLPKLLSSAICLSTFSPNYPYIVTKY